MSLSDSLHLRPKAKYMHAQVFTFNDFSENTYVLWDDTKSCLIIDPGCNNSTERRQLESFISDNQLQPSGLINTHCHIDHVLGNDYISEKYTLPLQAHKGEKPVLGACEMVAKMYGIPYTPSPDIEVFLEEGTVVSFGDTQLDILFTPGHSPASVSLYNSKSNILIAGDVLFQMSIGRTDLPGGNFDILENSIRKKLYTLPDHTRVLPGHGPETTIGFEKKNNPFVHI